MVLGLPCLVHQQTNEEDEGADGMFSGSQIKDTAIILWNIGIFAILFFFLKIHSNKVFT